MRQFLVFVQKEFYHIFRDRWTMMILLVLPILMIILFGFGISTEVKNAKFAVYDPSHDIATQKIVNKLDASEYFTFSGYINSPAEIDGLFKKGKIGLVLVFSENFYQNLLHTGNAKLELIADGTDPNTAYTLTTYTSNMLSSFQQELLGSSTAVPFQIKPDIKLLYNPTMKGAFNTVPGVMGMILLLIGAMMTSVSIAREKETGTMEVLLVSPMKPILIILSKVVPYFTISVINFATILLLSVFLLKVPVNGSLALLVAVSLLYIFISLALGLLISTLADSQVKALLTSGMLLMFPVILLSGLMFPIESMPVVLQYLSHLVPAKWYIIAIKNVMIKGLGFSSIIREVTILALMGTLILAASLKNFKNRLE